MAEFKESLHDFEMLWFEKFHLVQFLSLLSCMEIKKNQLVFSITLEKLVGCFWVSRQNLLRNHQISGR